MAHQSFLEAIKKDNEPFTVHINNDDYFGFFSNIRVDRGSLPEGWYAYDLRDSENGLEVCELVNGYVFANHFGTFCTRHPLPLDVGDSLYFASYKPENGYEKDSFDYEYADVDRKQSFEILFSFIKSLPGVNNYSCYKDFENHLYEAMASGVPSSLAKVKDAEISFSCVNKEFKLSLHQGSNKTSFSFSDDNQFVNRAFCSTIADKWNGILSELDIPEWKLKHSNFNSRVHCELFEIKRDAEILLDRLDDLVGKYEYHSEQAKFKKLRELSSALFSVSNESKKLYEPLENVINGLNVMMKDFDKKTSLHLQNAREKKPSNSR